VPRLGRRRRNAAGATTSAPDRLPTSGVHDPLAVRTRILGLREARPRGPIAVTFALEALGPELAPLVARYLIATAAIGMDRVVTFRLADASLAKEQADVQRQAWLTLAAARPSTRCQGAERWLEQAPGSWDSEPAS